MCGAGRGEVSAVVTVARTRVADISIDTVDTATAVQVTELGTHIGARIDGLRLGGHLSPATVSGIRAALAEHTVIFFRGQDHLTEGVTAPARRKRTFGPPTNEFYEFPVSGTMGSAVPYIIAAGSGGGHGRSGGPLPYPPRALRIRPGGID